MEYRDTIENISPANLVGFFEGWETNPGPDGLLSMLQNSSERIIAVEDGRVVGFVTAVTDKTLAAYIPFLEVLPEFRNAGVGTELAKRMLEKLSNFYMIDVVCDENLVPFYEQLGLRRGIAMSARNYSKRV